MHRVYTDKRFEGVELVNSGDTTIRVFRNGQETGSFKTCETPGKNTISEAFAHEQAKCYFECQVIDEEYEKAADRLARQPLVESKGRQIVNYLLAT